MTRDGNRPFQKDPKYERWRLQIFGITWLAYAGFYLTRKSFSIVKSELQDADGWGLTIGQLAWIDFYYAIAYAVGQFICGISGDRLGTRRVVLVGMMASTVTAFAMGASTITLALGIFACLQGLCQSTGWAPLAKNLCCFYSQHERGRAMGWWMTNYALGGFLASAYAGWAAEQFGWRYAFWVPAATLFVIWLLFIVFQRNEPEDVGLPPIEEYRGEEAAVLDGTRADESEGTWAVIFQVLKNRTVLLLAAVYLFLKPTRYLVMFWSPMYVKHKLDTGLAESGILGALFELAGPLAVIAGGYASDKLFQSRRMPISVICLFAVSVLLFFLDDLPSTRMALGLGLFALGFLVYIPESLVSGPAAIDFGTKRGASTASGLVNGFGSIGAVVGVTLPGWVASYMGPGEFRWDIVFIAMSISILIAALLLLPKWNALPQTASPAVGKPEE